MEKESSLCPGGRKLTAIWERLASGAEPQGDWKAVTRRRNRLGLWLVTWS
jgi:hypothetical protein